MKDCTIGVVAGPPADSNERRLAQMLRSLAAEVERSTLVPASNWLTISENPAPRSRENPVCYSEWRVTAQFVMRKP